MHDWLRTFIRILQRGVGRSSEITSKRFAILATPVPGGPADGESPRHIGEGRGIWTTTSLLEAREKCQKYNTTFGRECRYTVVTL